MKARIREGWERVKASGIDLLTEGIRLAQTAGEHFLQRIAERELPVPGSLRGVLERLAGRDREPQAASEDYVSGIAPADGGDFAPGPAAASEAGGAGEARSAEATTGDAAVGGAVPADAAAPAPRARRTRKPAKRAAGRPAAPKRTRRKPPAPADPGAEPGRPSG